MPLTDDQRRAIARIEVIDDAMVAVLRARTERERLEIAWGMWRSARDMIRSLLSAEHPDWPEEQVHAEAARRLASGSY